METSADGLGCRIEVVVVVDHSYDGNDGEESRRAIADEVGGRENAGVDVNLMLGGREIILEYATVTGREMRAVAMNERESVGRGFGGAEVHSVDYHTVT